MTRDTARSVSPSDASSTGATTPVERSVEQAAIFAPVPQGKKQPWKELLETEMKSGENPWLDWKPNPNDLGEKPWLDIDWHQLGKEGIRSRSPQMISGYSVGQLKEV